MAKHTITYNQLFAVDQDLKRLQQGSPALMLLLHKQINNFLKAANIELQILYKTISPIQLRYIEVDDNGKLRTEENGDFLYKKTVTDIKNARILSGEQVKEAYLQECNAFLERSCTIDL